MAAKTTTQKLLDLAGKFVTAQNGKWNHMEWEALLGDVAALGVELNDESRRNLGNILEASKYFHHSTATARPKRKAKAKAKSKPKAAKSKSKPKAKT